MVIVFRNSTKMITFCLSSVRLAQERVNLIFQEWLLLIRLSNTCMSQIRTITAFKNLTSMLIFHRQMQLGIIFHVYRNSHLMANSLLKLAQDMALVMDNS